MRAHHKATPSKSGLSKKKSKHESSVKTLKMTVDMVAYEAMTAEVGCRGVKGIEVRKRSAWNDARCDGRTYETVKLYGGVAVCDEEANWTEWEFEGVKEAGEEGVDYVVADCDGRVFHGKVWEIGLGRVVARHWEDPNRIRPGRPQERRDDGGGDDELETYLFDNCGYDRERSPTSFRTTINSDNNRDSNNSLRRNSNSNNSNVNDDNNNNNNNNNNYNNNNNNNYNNNNSNYNYNNNNTNNNHNNNNYNNQISLTLNEFTTHISALQTTFQKPMLDMMSSLLMDRRPEAPTVMPTPTQINPNSMTLNFEQIKELIQLQGKQR